MTSELPDGWTSLRLGDVLTLKRGYDLPAQKRREGPVPVVSSGGVTGFHDKPKVEPPGVVIGRYGSIGDVHFVTEPFWPLNTALYVQDFKGNDPQWCAALLQTIDYAAYSDKTSVPGINRNHLHQQLVMRPAHEEQERIAWVLASLDDRIENNRRIAETLDQIAATLFKAKFVDFVDQRDLVESPLGPIPGGWSVVPVADLAQYVNGKAFTKYGNGRGRMVIRIAELKAGPGQATVYTDHEAEPEFMAFPGDILFAWSGSLDVYRWHRDEALINQHIFKVTPDGYPGWFVYHALTHVMPHLQAIAADKATTMGHIKRSHLREYSVAVPPRDHLEREDRVFAPLFERALQASVEMETLKLARDRLLPRLISGEVRVPVADKAEAG